MKFEIPPVFFYAFGALLVVMGALRAYHLGWKQRPQSGPEEGEPEADATEPPREEGAREEGAKEGGADPEADVQPIETAREAAPASGWSRAAGGGHKRHITMGLLWVGLGLFLLISTLVNTGR